MCDQIACVAFLADISTSEMTTSSGSDIALTYSPKTFSHTTGFDSLGTLSKHLTEILGQGLTFTLLLQNK